MLYCIGKYFTPANYTLISAENYNNFLFKYDYRIIMIWSDHDMVWSSFIVLHHVDYFR